MIQLRLDWEKMKPKINGSTYEWIDIGDAYLVGYHTGMFELFCSIQKTDPPNNDQIDFEAFRGSQ